MVKSAQCGNLANFLPLRFEVKSIWADFRMSKTAELAILEALKSGFWKSSQLKMLKIPKKSQFKASTIARLVVFYILKSAKTHFT